jgi:hypothetical protein
MDVVMTPTVQVVPYEFNNRNHSDEQIARIAKSITEFGFNQPIVADADGTVIVGHGRLYAARMLGLTEVPVVTLADLTDAQLRAYRILDNKLQNDSSWHFNNLELELGYLEDNGFELEPYGLHDFKRFFGTQVEDVSKEWAGMPEFDQQEQGAIQSIKVHFETAADRDAFSALVGQTVTEKTKSIWYPPRARADLTDLVAVDDES